MGVPLQGVQGALKHTQTLVLVLGVGRGRSVEPTMVTGRSEVG